MRMFHIALATVAFALSADASAQATVSSDARMVLDQNSQLRTIPGFPNITFFPNVDQTNDGVTRGLNIQKCRAGYSQALQWAVLNQKCLVISFRGSPHSYQSGYNKVRTLEAVLFPESTRVVRVYETDIVLDPNVPRCQVIGAQSSAHKGFQLLAEFDTSGRMIKGAEPPFDPMCAVQAQSAGGAIPQATAPQGGQAATAPLENCAQLKPAQVIPCELRNAVRKNQAAQAALSRRKA